MGFLPLKCLDLLAKLISVTVHPVRLLAHALGIFGLELLDHLRVGLLSIGLVIEMHLLLELKRLLELLLQLLKVCLRLVTLRLKELESAFPQSTLLIKDVALLLQFHGRVVKLTSQLLIVVS